MSLETERRAIEQYFIANWSLTATNGMPDHPFTPPLDVATGKPVPSVRLTIINGEALQGSIGRVQNVIDNMGVLMVQIFTDGDLGRSGWTAYAEALLTLFHNKTLDASGALVTSGAQTALVRFSPPEAGSSCHPHVASSQPDAPFRVTTIEAPFVRYNLR